MTWKQFKEWAEENGVKDEDEICYMDFYYEPEEISRTQDGEVGIW